MALYTFENLVAKIVVEISTANVEALIVSKDYATIRLMAAIEENRNVVALQKIWETKDYRMTKSWQIQHINGWIKTTLKDYLWDSNVDEGTIKSARALYNRTFKEVK